MKTFTHNIHSTVRSLYDFRVSAVLNLSKIIILLWYLPRHIGFELDGKNVNHNRWEVDEKKTFVTGYA